MCAIFDNLFHRSQDSQPAEEAPIGHSMGWRVHWIDTTPVESTDKPCTLRSLDVQARISGLFAEVTQTLKIKNPNNRPISASLAIPLTDDAVVTGYALNIGDEMVDGVIVPKDRARFVFEREQRKGVDPGLVEAVRGNLYRTRVYPVPPHGLRTVRLSYVTPLVSTDGEAPELALAMPAEKLRRRTIRIEVEQIDAPKPLIRGLANVEFKETRGVWVAEAEEKDPEPGTWVRVALPELPASFALLERDEEGTVWFQASQDAPANEATEELEPPALTSLTVLWDASGSRASSRKQELALLEGYGASEDLKELTLVVFGDRVREVCNFSSMQELLDHLEEVSYDGGTNLTELSKALSELPSSCAGAEQGSACLLFTDALDTLSDEPFEMPSTCDVLAIISGTSRDLEAARQACHGLALSIDQAPNTTDKLALVIAHSKADQQLAAENKGIADACEVGPRTSSRRSFIGRVTEDEATLALGKETLSLSAADARKGGVLARAWAARRIATLSVCAQEHADELLELGRRYGIVSPATSLLVLESLDQWLEYDIEPPETLPQLRERWKQAREGRMSWDSEESRTRYHRRGLEQRWAEILRWHERDFAREAEQRSNTRPLPGRRRFCTSCGSELDPGARFCAFCGVPVPSTISNTPPTLADTVLPTGPSTYSHLDIQASPGMALEESGSEEEMSHGFRESFRPTAPTAAGMPRPRPRPMAMADSVMAMPTSAPASAFEDFEEEGLADCAPEGNTQSFKEPRQERPSAVVTIKPWNPNAPYLSALDEAYETGIDAAHEAYDRQRASYASAPSFFLDCAGWFMAHDDKEVGLRVLSNLAELRIEDAALLRVMGWRLREAGKLEQALSIMRHVLRLRPEDAQSHRDVAIVLDQLAREQYASGDQAAAKRSAEEAAEFYRKVALTPWERRPYALALFAVEEYNIMRAWADAQEWEVAPELPSLGDNLDGVPDCDLRITLAWDADETDVDIHVTEPGGEEAYYAHQLTSIGGRVSEDITDGYGPELYEIHHAQEGSYLIRAHFYASHQQTVFGPATCTLTVFTDWGRPEQTQQITSMRLDNARQMIPIGTAVWESK